MSHSSSSETDYKPSTTNNDIEQKYNEDVDGESNHELELRQIPSDAPGMPAAIENEHVDVPPDGGYGWVCVAAGFMINACTWGVNSSYGVYLAHYLHENVYPGATPLMYAFIGGLSISSSMIIGPLATLCLRKTSTRIVMMAGVFIETGALIAASFSKQIWHLFLTQGVLFGIGMGFLFTGSVGVISQWFAKKRSVATGITAAGSGIGGLIFSLSIRHIITTMGTPWAFRIVAVAIFVNNSICTYFTRDRNKFVNPNQRAFDLAILKRYEFLLTVAWGFFSMLGYVVILFSLPDFATSRGFSKVQGSVLGALLNLSMAFGRPLVGLSSDYYGRLNISGLMTLITGISCFVIWLPAKTFGVALFFSLVNGAVCGTFWTTIAPVCVEVVGLKDLPSALSLMWLSVVLPTTFSEPIGLLLRRPDFENQYLYPQIFSGVMYLAAAGCVYLLRAWKIGDNDRKEKEEEEKREAARGDKEDFQAPTEVQQEKTRPFEKWRGKDVSRWFRYGVV
ncbi:major facilitator superfamily domain-containing protein [Pyronema omphalodes]|nr:major facilitator superfamily domain-containing protein [Pyronema omphalodes]